MRRATPRRSTRSPLAAEIARRIGVEPSATRRSARFTTMRVGGPADLLATAHNAFELRGLVRFARARELPLLILGRGSNVIVSDRGVRGLVVHVRAEASRIEGDRYRAEAGVPMARAATETQKAGLSGPRVRAGDPGHRRRRGLGQRRRPRLGRRRRPRVGGRPPAPTAREATLAADELGLGLPRQPLQAPADRADREIVLGGTFRLAPADAGRIKDRLDDIRRWRQAHQPLGLPSAGSIFRNPDEGASAGRS